MQHIVKKQKLELRLENRQEAFQIQNSMSDFYWKKIIPELENIFDELSGDKDFFQIDKLEIDLGSLTIEQLNSTKNLHDLFPGIRSKIKEAILSQLKKTRPEKAVGVVSQWLYYMERGYLNWNTLTPDASWDQKVIETFATDYLSILSLRKLISRSEKALHRIATRHNELFLKRLIEVLTTENQDQLIQFVKELNKLLEQAGSLKENIVAGNLIVQKRIWEKIIWVAATGKEKQKSKEIAAEIIRWLVTKGTETSWQRIAEKHRLPYLRQLINEVFALAKKDEEGKKIITADPNKPNDGSESVRTNEKNRQKHLAKKAVQKEIVPEQTNKTDKTIIDDALNKIVQQKKVILQTTSQTESEALRQSKTGEKKITIDPDNEAPEEEIVTDQHAQENTTTEIYRDVPENEKVTDLEVLEEGIFVHHAGLVLLHPFFTALFNRLNLVNEGKFISTASQRKALYVLHYLATGKEEAEEFELLLPKFLTSYPLDEIIPAFYMLYEIEKEEANVLLEAAIEKWDVLRSTSPAALREGFLQRQGKLYSKNGNYYLQVEAGAIDMLLDHLPWNLSMLKLPWMKELLRVEWR